MARLLDELDSWKRRYGESPRPLLRLLERLAAAPGLRTSARLLRTLARSPMVYESPGADRGAWDRFHIRRLAAAAWPRPVRQRFAELLKWKRSGGEARYLRDLQRDAALRAELLRLGSE